MDPANEAQQRFWEIMAKEIGEGQTLLRSLRQAAAGAQDEAMRSTVAAIIEDVSEGATLAKALAGHPKVFQAEVVAAVRAGEYAGVFDWVASQLARLLAVEAGDLGEALAPLQPDAVEYVSHLIGKALAQRASDIHIEPLSGGRTRVRLRIDGVLQEVEPPPQGRGQAVVDYFKIMGAMNVKEHRLPQDGRCSYDKDGQTRTTFISTIPTHFGERLVTRIFLSEEVEQALDIAKLGLADGDVEAVRRLAHLPAGLVIANGPQGSGKTTVLYSMLQEVRNGGISIMTVEDPVEFAFDGIAQTGINPAIGLTFARGIRHIMRQDPDVILVGEIRDLEVAQLCIQCALTGHLVLTTLHANTSVGAIRRLVDIGVQPWLVSSALAGVISSRLVRRLCPHCRQPADAPTHSLPPEALEVLRRLPDAQFYRPVGCEKCGGGNGFKGRAGLFEVLVMDDPLRKLVTEGAPLEALRAAAVEAGMRTFLTDGVEKAARGVTTFEEVLRVLPVQP